MIDDDPGLEALVGNAASPKQVKRARQTEKTRAAEELADLRAVLSMPAGRRVIWRELGRHRLHETITAPDSMIYVLSGRRDAGLELLADVLQFEELYLLMQQEAFSAKRLEARTNAAARTARTTTVV